MGDAVSSQWYLSLNKAPWTPPGWMFGFAWSLIMVCFSAFLGIWFYDQKNKNSKLIYFTIALLLNVSWNFIFFKQQLIFLGLINLILLSTVIFALFFKENSKHKKQRGLLLPYMIWLGIATSLNVYIFIYN